MMFLTKRTVVQSSPGQYTSTWSSMGKGYRPNIVYSHANETFQTEWTNLLDLRNRGARFNRFRRLIDDLSMN